MPVPDVSELCRRLSWLLLLCLIGGGPALSAEAEGAADQRRVELTPFVAYRAGGSFEDDNNGTEYDLDSGNAWGATLTVPWTDITDLEVWYSRQSAGISSPSASALPDLELQHLHLGGTYHFDLAGGAVPFFLATVGATRIDSGQPGIAADDFFSFAVGGGWKINPGKRIGMRVDGRVLGTVIDSDSRLLCAFSGSSESGCLLRTSGRILWQFEVQAGIVMRF